MNHNSLRLIAVCAFLMTLFVCTAFGQEAGVTFGGNSIESTSVDKLNMRTVQFVCGGKDQQGTPIAGNSPPADGTNKTSGSIVISGIPATIGGLPTTVVRAHLFWTVLTNSATSSTTGQTVLFNGNPVAGLKIGSAAESPCFPQANTIAYRADVTSLVTSPGNGVYTVSGFPGGTGLSSDFTEGATLQILWSNPNGPLREDNLYHALGDGAATLAVTQGDAFSQTLSIFGTNSAGPVSATLYEVIGNGQNSGTENLRFTAACSPVGGHNFDNSLDGSTSHRAPNTCDSTIGTQCFWDDDIHDVSSDFACPAGNAATSATLTSSGGSDCIDWPALDLLTSTDEAHVAAACGAFVDTACPPTGTYQNHGEYVSCVAHAAEQVLSGLPLGGSCPREEIQSACVNPRARSEVGKK